MTSPTRRKLKWTEFLARDSFASAPRKPEDTFIVCVTRQEKTHEEFDALVAQCNDHLGRGQVLQWSCNYAGYYFTLQWQHRALAYPVMDFLLRQGMPVFTQTRMCVNLSPADLKEGDTCTPEWVDRTTAISMRKVIETYLALRGLQNQWSAIDTICGSYGQVYSHESSWLTEEGRALVRWIVAKNKLNADSSDEETLTPREPALDHPREVDAADEPPAKAPRLTEGEGEDDDNTCLICMDQKPDTLVLPCMHSVVCRACSAKLQQTGDARTCVKCRRPIENVMQDGSHS